MADNYAPQNNQSSSPPQYLEDLSHTAPPPPPSHRHLRPGMHPESNFSRQQDQRSFGTLSHQGQFEDARESGTSPVMHRVPSRSPTREAALVPRELSPSPLMHPGIGDMPAFPPPASANPYHDHLRSPIPTHARPTTAGAGMGGAVLGGATGAPAFVHDDYLPPPGNFAQYGYQGDYSEPSEHDYDGGGMPYHGGLNSHNSYSSDVLIAGRGMMPGSATPNRTDLSFPSYQDYSTLPTRVMSPYQDHQQVPTSRSHEKMMSAAAIDPNDILDDGDDFVVNPKRGSRVSLPFNKSKANLSSAGVLGGVGPGAIGDDMAGAFPRNGSGGNYGPVPAKRPGTTSGAEKSGWSVAAKPRGRLWKKLLFIVVVVSIIAGIAVGAVVGVISQQKSNKEEATGKNAAAADQANGDLSKDSGEIKKLLNNPDLHKVFSGFAYTPIGAQYPECLSRPPSQNNVTRDMAVIGQLTNVVRLYGTDCNQTEMVFHAIDKLALTDMKVWVGAWLGNNDTTNARQIDQMWKILDSRGTKNVKGVVVGNEVLFRKDLTDSQLAKYLSDTKSKLQSKGLNLPVATSDLGDNWTASLASEVDVVMSNVHPFFGGIPVDQSASWTYTFWQTHDVAVTAGMANKQHIISEFGWPSGGGNNCGSGGTCSSSTQGAVASIDNMNKLMTDWVCQALSNGTDYFWFEAFDEPWKIQYNTPGKEWEDKWGLMDVNRNLKKGLKIPTCGGSTAPAS